MTVLPADLEAMLATLPDLPTDKDLASILPMTAETVRNERKRGRLGYLKLGGRYYHPREIVREYLLKNWHSSCPASPALQTQDPDPASSANIGSEKSPAEIAPPMPGAGSGTIPEDAKRAMSALARQTFGKRGKGSQSGISPSIDPRTPPPPISA